MATFDGPGGRVHYLDHGDGEPAVVLLHAFPLHASMWEPQIAFMAPTHRVVAPDLTGFGQSDVPTGRGDYSVDRWAGEVADLVLSLGLGRARVVVAGLSMGGYVALAFARLYPELLAGLILADTRPGADSAEIRARREQQQARLAGTAHPGDVADALLGPLVGDTSSRRAETLAMARSLLSANSSAGLIGGLEGLKTRPDATAGLALITAPTMVVVGDQDKPSPPAVAQEMAAAIPGASLVVVPDAGHLSNLENPAAFNQALVDFVDQLGNE